MAMSQDADGVKKPLLPAVDAAGQLREMAFALLMRDGRPIETAALGTHLGLRPEVVRGSVETLAAEGWLDLDEAGRIVGAAGLSLTTGPHGLTIEQSAFRTWCAYDALGIAAALLADALIETTCGVCGSPIRLTFRGGVPDRDGSERLWLAVRGEDLRGSFCTPTVLLCGADHAGAWAVAHGGNGRLLELAEATRLGGAEWSGCADAARRLA